MSEVIKLNLLVPAVSLKLGFFEIDPIKQALGVSLEEVLESLLLAPVERMPSPSGRGMVDVYKLGLPEGEGVSIPLGGLGELGFWNERGLLELTVPYQLGQAAMDRLRDHVVKPAETVRAADGVGWCARLTVRLRPGAATSLQVGGLGELGLVAA